MLWRKRRQRKPKTVSHIKSLMVNAGPKVMQWILKQNLRKPIIYDKPRPAARGNEQTIASKGCKKIKQISTASLQLAPNVHVNTNDKCTKCITIRAEHPTIFDNIIYVWKRYKGVEKLSTLISGCCSCIKSVSLINNSRWLKAESKISGFLKSTKWSGCEYKCLTTSVLWWLDFKGLYSSSRNFKFLYVWPR